MAKKFYTLDEAKKEIIIDKTVKPTELDLKMVGLYMSQYKVREKIIRTVKKGSKAQMKDADIKKALKDKKEALAEYERIKKESNFFKARAYALTVIK